MEFSGGMGRGQSRKRLDFYGKWRRGDLDCFFLIFTILDNIIYQSIKLN